MYNDQIRERHRWKEIQMIKDKYGPICFHMGLSKYFTWGPRHITEESVEKTKTQIMEEAKADTSGSKFLFSPEAECYLMDIALELAQFSLWDVLAYVKTDDEMEW